ncbi:hypothetical protein FACS189490_12230 [Clostridia bacterium]|nr:hypothetical protein FACS189490_12230 [Clostridia bacterium]
MFAENFNRILKERSITPYRVAKGTGINQGTIGRYANGTNTPEGNNLLKISEYLNVSVDELLNNKYPTTNNFSGDIKGNVGVHGINHGTIAVGHGMNVSGNLQLNQTEDEDIEDFKRIFNTLNRKDKTRLMTLIYDFEEGREGQ